jgi:hypothetical protein
MVCVCIECINAYIRLGGLIGIVYLLWGIIHWNLLYCCHEGCNNIIIRIVQVGHVHKQVYYNVVCLNCRNVYINIRVQTGTDGAYPVGPSVGI